VTIPIPPGWKEFRLSELAEIERHIIDPTKIQSGSVYIGLEHITGEGEFINVRQVENGEIASSKFAFDDQHILYGKLRPYLRKIALPSFSGICSTDIVPIRVKQARAERSYLFHYLRRPQMVLLAEARSVGANLPRISPNTLREFPILAPTSVAEQRRIAAILNQADAIYRKRRQAAEETDTFLRATFLDMFGDPVASPPSHDIVPLEQFINSDRPITYGILMPGPDLPEGVPYVRVLDMQAGRILIDQVRRTSEEINREYRRSRLRAGDLLLSIRGRVGRTAVVPDELDGANITQDTARLAARSEEDTIFLRGCIETPGMQRLLRRLTKGGAVKGINLGDVRRLPVPLPPTRDRARFAEISRNVEQLIQGQRDALAESKNLFASLSQRAFRGELQ
jgi:type I restriction enzyme S subunit